MLKEITTQNVYVYLKKKTEKRINNKWLWLIVTCKYLIKGYKKRLLNKINNTSQQQQNNKWTKKKAKEGIKGIKGKSKRDLNDNKHCKKKENIYD